MTKPINKIDREAINHFEYQAYYRLGADAPNLLDLYQEVAVTSAIYPGQGTPFGVMYCALGLAEAGEVQNKVKKLFRDDEAIEFEPFSQYPDGSVAHATVRFEPVTEERREQIKKEMGGVLWYLAALAQELDLSLSEIALANLEELCSRGERGTLQGSGDDR